MSNIIKCLLLISMVCSASLFSQDEQIESELNKLRGRKIPSSLLNEISIHLDNEPMELALADISEKGQLNLSYSRNLLPLKKKVSVHMDNVYAIKALLAVLQQTSTMLQITKSGALAIMPAAGKSTAKRRSSSFKGLIKGVVTDSTSGEPLPGANIVIKGTAIGAASDLNGDFRILNAPTGKFVLRIAFIGYKSKEIPITVMPGKTVKIDAKLEFDVIKFEQAVVVTAQLEGQAAAINQQIRSNTIVNVVSKDKIQELPDQNAAESLGRLPGIAIQRSAGEGQKVVVRGLSPRFSAVTVNGERIPATTMPGAFDYEGTGRVEDDRSVDLSMISPDVLAGIEVYKALRPDMDGDAIGGSINFVTKKAPEGARTIVRLLGGYNALDKDYGNYKSSFSYSNRFLSDENAHSKLGIVVAGSMQRANRSSDLVNGTYYWSGEVNGEPVYQTDNISLMDHSEIRDRYSLNLSMDYNLGLNHDIIFSSLLGRTTRDEVDQTHNYVVENRSHIREFLERDIGLNMWSNALAGNHLLGPVELTWRTSFAKTLQKTPWAAYFEFRENSAFSDEMPIKNVNPQFVPTYAKNNAKAAWFDRSFLQGEIIQDRNLTAQLDIKYPFRIEKSFSGNLKIGGKIRDALRTKDLNQWGGLRWQTGQKVNTYYDDWFIDASGQDEDIALLNFINQNTKIKDFLKGEYEFNEVLDTDKLHWFATTFDSIYKATPDLVMDAQDYVAGETIAAAYVMAECSWKQKIMFLSGVRYERTTTNYSTKLVIPTQSSNVFVKPAFNDTLGNRSYENILPMTQIRIKPLNWFDIRVASTQSLSRPDFYNLIPYEKVNWDLKSLRYGNSHLKETTALNYDAYLSFYGRFGLLTLGTFYKKIKNIDYIRDRIMTGGYYSPYIPNLKGWTVISPENLENETIAKGWEFELQTNFKFLPSPLDGIVLYANFSIINSETAYPYTIYRTSFIPTPPYVITTSTDTARVGRMLGQSDKIANLTIGYEKRGFSSRLSMIYQGNSLRTVGRAEENDGLDDDFVRWDFVLQQRIYKGLKLVAQVNNITDQQEKTYIRYKKYPTRRERFGRTIDIGFQFEY